MKLKMSVVVEKEAKLELWKTVTIPRFSGSDGFHVYELLLLCGGSERVVGPDVRGNNRLATQLSAPPQAT